MARIFVTGAGAGLGELTAQTLIDEGHDVVLHARNAGRFEDARLTDRALGTVYGDLADLHETFAVAEAANEYGRFDAVIDNAGVIDGRDLVQVNVVAPYVLSSLMHRPGRVIVVSSSMHTDGSQEKVVQGVSNNARVSYSDTKLGVTALTMGLARRWPDTLVHCLCPGWVPTRMGGPSASDDLTEGHRTQEWLATAPESEIRPRTGGYWHHRLEF